MDEFRPRRCGNRRSDTPPLATPRPGCPTPPLAPGAASAGTLARLPAIIRESRSFQQALRPPRNAPISAPLIARRASLPRWTHGKVPYSSCGRSSEHESPMTHASVAAAWRLAWLAGVASQTCRSWCGTWPEHPAAGRELLGRSGADGCDAAPARIAVFWVH